MAQHMKINIFTNKQIGIAAQGNPYVMTII